MSSQELCFRSLAEQARLIRDRQASPVDLVSSVLCQIERIEPEVQAYITILPDEALAAARRAEREITTGAYRGPLHGIPVALKDMFYTKGVRTTAGSQILRDFVPDEDATTVARLKLAGAVIVGKTKMHEFGLGPTATDPHCHPAYGDTRNPWDLGRMTGGSSGGSAAAVVASMCSAALGGDTGGSIRIPAALCGVVGLKPTYGRVSRHGTIPCAWSLDHVGPLCKTAEDAALVLAAIAGLDPKDPASSHEPVSDYGAELTREPSGMKIAILREYASDPMEPDVVAGFRAALDVLQRLGMSVGEVSIPMVEYAIPACHAIAWAEATSYHEEHLRTRAAEYGPDVRARLELGLLVAASDYVKAQRVRRLLIDEFVAVLERYDAIVCPTVTTTAPRLEQETTPASLDFVRHTRLFNLIGLPTASVPCGFDANGLPIGLQIAAAPFAEGAVLRIAQAYQQATDWHRRAPAAAMPPEAASRGNPVPARSEGRG